MKNDRTCVECIEIDGRAPTESDAASRVRLNTVKAGAVRPEMVVDDIKHHREADSMCPVGQAAQIVRCAIATCRREETHAVVAPVPTARSPGLHIGAREGECAVGHRRQRNAPQVCAGRVEQEFDTLGRNQSSALSGQSVSPRGRAWTYEHLRRRPDSFEMTFRCKTPQA